MALVTSYDQAKIDDLLADLQTWATANLAPITEPLAVNAQAAANAAQADVDTLDTQVVKLSGNQAVAGEKTFTDRLRVADDASIGTGADGSAGSYVELGSLGTGSAWVDARGSTADVALFLRAKGSSSIYANSKLELPAGILENSTIVNGASYSATVADRTIVVNVASTITLPNNAGGLYQGKRYTIINNGSGMVTVSAPSAGLSGFTTTIPSGVYNSLNLWSDGFGYYSEGTAGRIICTSTTRPTGNLYAGLEIYETDTKRTRIYSGSGWETHSETFGGTYTPTLTNITGGSASGKWKYISQYLMHVQIAITAGTWTTAGTIVTASLPPGITSDTFMTQPALWNFNNNISPTGFVSANDTKVTLSYINPQTAANIAAGTSMANARIEAVISIQ